MTKRLIKISIGRVVLPSTVDRDKTSLGLRLGRAVQAQLADETRPRPDASESQDPITLAAGAILERLRRYES